MKETSNPVTGFHIVFADIPSYSLFGKILKKFRTIFNFLFLLLFIYGDIC